MTPRILVLGANGSVGWELQRALAPLGHLIAYDRRGCDLADGDSLRRNIAAVAPHVIVNAAAYTAVDKAEQEPALAERINAHAVGVIAEYSRQVDALFVHYSTDYVFDGLKADKYGEDDATNPQSVYGRSKRAGEENILANGCRHLIFRTSWVFSARGTNFTSTMLRLAQERESLRVIADQWGAPTAAELIADVTAHALRATYMNHQKEGLYHLTAGGETNWHAYATFVIDQARALGATLKVTDIKPIGTHEYPLPAKRPLNSRLNTEKLRATFGLTLPDWRYHVQRLLVELHGTSK